VTFPEPVPWQLAVVGVEARTPRMRAIDLTAPNLDQFDFLPGQDVSLAFPLADGTTVRRRYTIRRFDRARRSLEIDVVMHGGGPGMRWAEAAEPGMEIDAIAPRGKITIAPAAGWHLFAGDATAVPAAFAMMEALPLAVPAFGIFLVDDANERQPLVVDGDGRTLHWRYQSAERDPSAALAAAIGELELPDAPGHAYLAGEVSLVSFLKASLVGRGWRGDQISAKAYWNRGRANAGHGEPMQKAS
jgi:NADPH-dependent ferric siderophore reductase